MQRDVVVARSASLGLSLMPTASSDSDLTPDQRFRQIAAILARGVRRHRQLKRRYESCEPKTSAEDVATGLEVLGETRLSVSRFQGLSVHDKR
mgnify:CR=1 FL=1|jgi:hypothetical protein